MRRLFSSYDYEASATLAGLLMLIVTCGAAAAQEFGGREKLRAHSAELRSEVIKVTNGVWVAVGFSDANSALIEGDGASIVVVVRLIVLPSEWRSEILLDLAKTNVTASVLFPDLQGFGQSLRDNFHRPITPQTSRRYLSEMKVAISRSPWF